MERIVFDSKLLSDGHLFIPKEYKKYKIAEIKVILTIYNQAYLASDEDVEMSSVNDVSDDFLSEKEIDYYMKLKDNE